jgi:NADPH:quinone reductase-like Zn-dependent oxidoreductase
VRKPIADVVVEAERDLGEGTLQHYIRLNKSAPITRKPSTLSFAEAAALPLVYMTVYDALVIHGKLPLEPKPEDVGKRGVLILGGSSGTGSVAIQMAKKMGLKVVTTCSDKNKQFVTDLGADEVSPVPISCISTMKDWHAF